MTKTFLKKFFFSVLLLSLVLFGGRGVRAHNDIAVHGSRAGGKAGPTSDLDIAIRVSPERFNEIANQIWGDKNYPQALEQYGRAMRQGKIGLAQNKLWDSKNGIQNLTQIETQISIIKIGGSFDQGPYIQVP